MEILSTSLLKNRQMYVIICLKHDECFYNIILCICRRDALPATEEQ